MSSIYLSGSYIHVGDAVPFVRWAGKLNDHNAIVPSSPAPGGVKVELAIPTIKRDSGFGKGPPQPEGWAAASPYAEPLLAESVVSGLIAHTALLYGWFAVQKLTPVLVPFNPLLHLGLVLNLYALP